MQIVGVGNTSYKTDEKAIGGVLHLLTKKEMTTVSRLYWKNKQIEHVYHSSKGANTIIMS